jgi:hypothetical protein
MTDLSVLAANAALLRVKRAGLLGAVAKPLRALGGGIGRAVFGHPPAQPTSLRVNSFHPTPAAAAGATGSTVTTFGHEIAPYYKDVPGGYNAAVRSAVSARTAHPTPSYSPLSFSPTSLERPVNVDVHPFEGRAYGVYAPRTDSVSLNSATLAGKNPGAVQSVLEHELTHARVQGSMATGENLLTPGGSKLGPYAAPEHMAYFGTSIETDPRLAQIKRLYAQRTGRLVDTPEEGRKALDWYGHGWFSPSAGMPSSPGAGYIHDRDGLLPAEVFHYYNQPPAAFSKWKDEAAARMTQLLGAGGLAGAAGLASQKEGAALPDVRPVLRAVGNWARGLTRSPSAVGQGRANARIFTPAFAAEGDRLGLMATNAGVDVQRALQALRDTAVRTPNANISELPAAKAYQGLTDAHETARATFEDHFRTAHQARDVLAKRYAAGHAAQQVGVGGGVGYGAYRMFGDKIRALVGGQPQESQA